MLAPGTGTPAESRDPSIWAQVLGVGLRMQMGAGGPAWAVVAAALFFRSWLSFPVSPALPIVQPLPAFPSLGCKGPIWLRPWKRVGLGYDETSVSLPPASLAVICVMT